jgi:bifunctional enzyme CysN/CysC
VHIASDRNLIDARFPVQYVIRPQQQTDHDLHDYRGYAGTVAGGVLKVGDEVVVLPSGKVTTIAGIDTPSGPADAAYTPMSVTITLADEVDVSRGDMIARRKNQPHQGQDIDAMVCWMSDSTWLREGAKVALKHTTRWVRAVVKDLQYQLDVNTLHRYEDAVGLSLNEIGRVSLRTTQPLLFDEYRRNRTTGSFILVDEASNTTVGAGMILGPTGEV